MVLREAIDIMERYREVGCGDGVKGLLNDEALRGVERVDEALGLVLNAARLSEASEGFDMTQVRRRALCDAIKAVMALCVDRDSNESEHARGYFDGILDAGAAIIGHMVADGEKA